MTDNNARPLRAVGADPSSPMTVPELQSHGNALLVNAMKASRHALRASTKLDILYETRSYGIRDIERMQRQAEEAWSKWRNVSAILDEIVREFHNSNRSAKRPGGDA